jgi:hypothetical protein
MAESRIFTANVVLRDPDTYESRVFLIGEDVPEWASVGDHAAQVGQGVTRERQITEGEAPTVTAVTTDEDATDADVDSDDETADEVEPYDQWLKADLKEEAKGRELEGYSTMTKDELVELLTQDDEASNQE